MPNYDLRCIDCNTEHNIRASMKEKSEKQISCPNCGSFELETVFKTAPAFVKGMSTPPCPQRSACGAACPHAK
ncbi:MAG: zinc ribbon domain-containing protein [Defluviitaleaceae bacterium]|nr:zinc ribbon domain-containing protein [Defluviitaleaceae bacterium]